MTTTYTKKNSGSLLVTVLVFMSIFLVILTSLASSVLTQRKYQIAKEEGVKAFQIAEAGLEYYKWHLAHNPGDIWDGTGTSGPYIHDYSDLEATSTGKFSLEITGDVKCGEVSNITISSTGWTNENPNIQKTVVGTYGRPLVSDYSVISNSDVRAASDREFVGPYHSNGFVIMNGTNYNAVTSAVSTTTCGTVFCPSAPSTVLDGVSGGGSGSSFWLFPTVQIDFTIINQNIANIKNKTASTTPGTCTSGQTYGCYWGPSGAKGYRIVFNSNGTFTLYRVNTIIQNWAWPIANQGVLPETSTADWVREENIISTSGGAQTNLGTYTLPSSCKLIFVEDKLWIEGTVEGKITVAAADLTAPVAPSDIIFSGNVDYQSLDGTDGLTAISQRHILAPLNAPNNLTTRGIYVAQSGNFGRNIYISSPCRPSTRRIPSGYRVDRNSWTMYGTVVSNGRTGSNWGYPTISSVSSARCHVVNGVNNRYDSYDPTISADPPPLTPFVKDEYRFIEWDQD
jgi:hypothetical protein